MQPPQGPYSQDDYGLYPEPPAQQDLWAQQQNGSWVQRPLPGQGANGVYPGQVPPPAQIPPEAGGAVYPDQGPYAAVPPEAQGQPMPQGMPVGQPPVGPAYQAPQTGVRTPRRRSRRGVLALVVLALCAAVVVMILLNRSGPSRAYGYVRSGSMEARFSGDAVIVRNEVVYSEAGVSQIDYVAEEGAQVTRGNIVATIYTSGFNAKEWTTLQNYRNQIKEYQKILIAGATTDTRLLSLMNQVRSRALEVQRLVQGEAGSFSSQEKLLTQAMQDQQIYIRQKYPDDQKLSRLNDDENAQRQRISQWTKQFAAASDGLVSFYTDGYESALNTLTYADYSPAQVRAMYNGRIPETGQGSSRNMKDIYRMVRQEPWAVLVLCNEKEWTPTIGRTYKMLIENFDNIIVDATVESFTLSGGELLVRLTVNNTATLPNVLYLRTCQVQLGENVSTLQVPSRAIYVQNGRKGVVMYTEGGEYWTGVEVVSDDGTTAYVIPDNAGVLYDGIPVRLF